MRVAQVGFGGNGRAHAANAARNPAMELAAVCDPSPEARADAAAAYGVPTYESLGDLLREVKVDGVLVSTPSDRHVPTILEAARAGKHVFCEKPLCVRPEEAEEARRAVEESGVTFGFGLVLRYMAPYARIRQMLRAGELGRVLLVHGRYGGLIGPGSYVYSARRGGGLLNEHTIHLIDVIDHLFGPITSVAACLNRLEGRETEDSAGLLLFLEGGACAAVSASGVTRLPVRLDVTAERGEVSVLGNTRLEAVTPDGPREVELESVDGYAAEVEEWRLAAAEGRQPRTGLREALRTVAVIQALHEAGRTGAVVPVPRPEAE